MNFLTTSMAVAVVCALGTTPVLAAEGGQQTPAVPPPAPATARPTPVPPPAPQPAARAAAAPRAPQSRGFIALGGVFQFEKGVVH